MVYRRGLAPLGVSISTSRPLRPAVLRLCARRSQSTNIPPPPQPSAPLLPPTPPAPPPGPTAPAATPIVALHQSPPSSPALPPPAPAPPAPAPTAHSIPPPSPAFPPPSAATTASVPDHPTPTFAPPPPPPPPPPPSPPPPPPPSGPGPARRFLSTTLLILTSGALVAYYYDSRSMVHEKVAMPILRRVMDAEQGHKAAVKLLSTDWARPKDRGIDGEELRAELFGQPLSNPVGMAAGFDKDGDAIDGLFDLGFGYVEVGSVTPQPQPGNPNPRFFRLEEDAAAINRYGFNSLGHAHMLVQLRARIRAFSQTHPSLFPSPLPSVPLPPSGVPRSLRPGHILAVNLGKNKTSPAESNDDYIRGVRMLGPYADVIVINVSSPNTPGLRALQGREILERLLSEVVQERNRIQVDGLPKVAVKVACDLSEEELGDVAAAVRGSGVEGVIVSNTTVKRAELNLQSRYSSEIGGLSGRPLFPLALSAVRTIRPLLPPSIPVIGCGGISTASDALAMAQAGASLVQIYTSFGYRGVGAPRLLKDEISAHLNAQGRTWQQVFGSDYKGGEMGWDEKRLGKDSARLKAEANDLAALLRKRWKEDDTARLIEEAEAVLGGSRDNLAGRTEQKEPMKEGTKEDVFRALQDAVRGEAAGAIRGLIGTEHAGEMAGRQQPDVQAIAAGSGPASTQTPTPAMPPDLSALISGEGVDISHPVGGPMGPVVVHSIGEDRNTPDDRDEWSDSVRGGPRRLV